MIKMESKLKEKMTNINNSLNSNNFNNGITDRKHSEYLAQLLSDKKSLLAFPNVFQHLDKILDDEISRVRSHLFNVSSLKETLQLPEPEGNIVTLTEKLPVPIATYPDFNFVGRILGPRGMTAKQLELDTGCRILVRGKGSMRDKIKEEQNRDKPNWEHLKEELHVLITVEDSENRATLKLARAVQEVKKLLVPSADGEDDLKKLQLMELAIMNGTYRENAVPVITSQHGSRIIATPLPVSHQMLGSPLQAAPPSGGTPILIAPRLPVSSFIGQSPSPLIQSHAPQTLIPQGGESGGLFYQYSSIVPTSAAIIDYSSPYDANSPGKIAVRRAITLREHPYQRG